MKPLVSIITPTYNHENYIEKCIVSVIKQTYTRWEMIIIDDCSTDKTYEVVCKYIDDPRIKVVRHHKNWGINKLADTYNEALKGAKGQYIAILEGDDFWPSHKLEKQVRCFKKNKVVLSYGTCVYTNSYGIPINIHTYNENISKLNNKPIGSILELFCRLNFSIIPVTVMIRIKFLKKIGGFQKSKIYPFTDVPTFLKLCKNGEFCFKDEILGYYRKQPTSEWFNYASKTSTMGREELKKSLTEFVNNSFDSKKHLQRKYKQILNNQNRYLKIKKRNKSMSLLLNYAAFNLVLNPLILIFLIQYICWKYKKL